MKGPPPNDGRVGSPSGRVGSPQTWDDGRGGSPKTRGDGRVGSPNTWGDGRVGSPSTQGDGRYGSPQIGGRHRGDKGDDISSEGKFEGSFVARRCAVWCPLWA